MAKNPELKKATGPRDPAMSQASTGGAKRSVFAVRLWHKLFVAMVLLLTIALLALLAVIHQRMRTEVKEQLDADLFRADRVQYLLDNLTDNSLVSRVRDFEWGPAADILRKSAKVKGEASADGGEEITIIDLPALGKQLWEEMQKHPLLGDPGTPVCVILNNNGDVMLNLCHPTLLGENVSDWAMHLELREGQALSMDWWAGRDVRRYLPDLAADRLYMMRAYALKDSEGSPFASMILGEAVDLQYFSRIQNLGQVGTDFSSDSRQRVQWGYILDREILTTSISDWKLRDALEEMSNVTDLLPEMNEIKFDGLMYRCKLQEVRINRRQIGKILMLKEFTSAFNDKLAHYLSKFFWVVIAGSLLVLTFALAMAKGITRGLDRVIGGLKKIGQGDFGARVSSQRSDEVGDLALAFNQMSVNLETGNFVEKTLQKYVSQDVIDAMLGEGGSSREELSIMHTNIVDFRRLTLGMTPEKMIEWLNRYFGSMSEIIEKNGGVVDLMAGDSITAFWNAPRRTPKHPVVAALSALEQIRLLESEVAEEWELHYGARPRCRIGLHLGQAIVGNIITGKRTFYTALGDDVSLTTTLEEINKVFKTRIIISDPFFRQLDARFICRPLERILHGEKRQALTLYELVEERDRLKAARILFHEEFSRMTATYWKKEFMQALSMCENMDTDEPAVKLYIKRCKIMIAQPPPDNWQGEWVDVQDRKW